MFGIRLTGLIRVWDAETSSVIEPVSVVLGARYETREQAEAQAEVMQRVGKSQIVKEVVEVA